MADRYLAPGWFTKKVLNGLVAASTRVGLPLAGSRVLAVRGRRSGEWRTTPVNLLVEGDDRYLVAPRGVTDWVRNLRAAGEGELRYGRRVERFTASEVTDVDAKVPLLRSYLARWKWEVGVFFEGVGPDSTDEQLAAVSDDHPVFRITTSTPTT
jgi:deazaflavin-dependent oxidoreductase (nitroreductase family)